MGVLRGYKDREKQFWQREPQMYLPFMTAWTAREDILLSDASQTETNTIGSDSPVHLRNEVSK